MKYVKQFGIILLISFLGELLNYLIPLPIPASIYGIVILFIALLTGLLKVSDIKEASSFLLDIMPILFIPAAVGLMESFGLVRRHWLPIVFITIISTVVVMGISGCVTQWIGRDKNE